MKIKSNALRSPSSDEYSERHKEKKKMESASIDTLVLHANNIVDLFDGNVCFSGHFSSPTNRHVNVECGPDVGTRTPNSV